MKVQTLLKRKKATIIGSLWQFITSNYFKSKVAMEKEASEKYSNQVNYKQSFHFFFLCVITQLRK